MSETTIIVDLTDEAGRDLFRAVPVTIEYVTLIDDSYGEDADGHRGTVLVEREVLDKYIDAQDLLVMTSDQVERALADAEAMFYQRWKRGAP